MVEEDRLLNFFTKPGRAAHNAGRRRAGYIPVAIALLGCWTSAAFGAGERDTFSLRLGMIFFNADGSFASTRDDKIPIDVKLNDVGIDAGDSGLFASATWNISQRWTLRFDTFGFDSSGDRAASRDFEFDDTVVKAGAGVEGELDVQIYLWNLGYRFIDRPRWELGAGVGVHYINLDYGFKAQVNVGSSESAIAEEQVSESFPVPNIYAWSQYRINDRLGLYFHGGWLSAAYGDYDGQIYFARLGLEYDLSKRFGAGVGYWLSDFDVDRDTGTKVENYHVKLPGIQVYLKAKF